MATNARRLKRALSDINRQKAQTIRNVTYTEWLATQPGSTKRGIARGKFQYPAHILPVVPMNLVHY